MTTKRERADREAAAIALSPDKELVAAWQRVIADKGAKGDGARLLIWLRRCLLSVTPIGASSCAVHDHEGYRRLAAELLNFAVSEQYADRERHDADADLRHERRRRDAVDNGGERRGIKRRGVPA